MPRIDPQQLLVCLTPLLANNGGIKSPNEVIRLANLMEKYSKKLVSKCIYIQILKCTETELLAQFMAAGGWNLVHNWLRDGSETSNWAFVQELLEMLLLCPVDGNRLKSNHTPKIVKNLSLSCPHVAVKILSSKLVEQWLKIAHQEKQLLSSSQLNGFSNGLNGGVINSVAIVDDSLLVSNVDIVKETETVDGQVSFLKSEEDSTKKQSKENLKYKISNKEGGKLLLSLKRSISPSGEEKSSKVPRTSSQDSKSKSSSSSSDRTKEKSKTSSSSSHRSGSSSKSSHRDKERSSSSSSSHHKSSSSKDRSKDSSKSSSSKHSSSSKSSRDKDKDHEKRKKETEKSQAEKDKETLDLLAPLSSNKLQRIPKRQHSDNSENKSAESNKDPSGASLSKTVKNVETVEKKKPSISIEVRKGEKPKTVKTLNSQFRNHGLAEEPPKPPSRKDIKKPATNAVPLIILPSVGATPTNKTSISPPLIKKLNMDKAFEPDVPERVGGVKLIKPKPMLVESIGFMDALSASATVVKKDPKKRKRLLSSSKKDDPESPKGEMKPLKFYKDTLEEAEEDQLTEEKSATKELEPLVDDKENKEECEVKSPESPGSLEKLNGNSTLTEEKSKPLDIEKEEYRVVKRGPGIGCGVDGPPGVLVDLTVPRRKKRSIQWKEENELTEIRYFELDETERTNVSKTFIEQKAMEHGQERDAFEQGRKMQNANTIAEQTEWRPLIIVDNVPDNVNFGYKSREAEIQAEREKNVLQELYFRHSINDSPHEPDAESYEHTEPQIIPLDDVTGNPDSVNNFTDIQWPAPKGDLPSTFSSNAFGNVFTNINIPSALSVAPTLAMNSLANPLANFPLGLSNPIAREPPNPILGQWLVPPASFLQPPPGLVAHQGPPQGFGNRDGMNNSNSFRNNNRSNNNNGGGGNWVRGNSRRGVCNQFQRNGFCRNKNCPYIHER